MKSEPTIEDERVKLLTELDCVQHELDVISATIDPLNARRWELLRKLDWLQKMTAAIRVSQAHPTQ
jgi:hypothetical protein